MAKEETIEYIVRMANDMETIENFMGCTGRFVGSMYHVSIKSMAAHIRAQPPQPAVAVEKVRELIKDMSVAHGMSHEPFCDGEGWKDEFDRLERQVLSLLPPKESK